MATNRREVICLESPRRIVDCEGASSTGGIVKNPSGLGGKGLTGIGSPVPTTRNRRAAECVPTCCIEGTTHGDGRPSCGGAGQTFGRVTVCPSLFTTENYVTYWYKAVGTVPYIGAGGGATNVQLFHGPSFCGQVIGPTYSEFTVQCGTRKMQANRFIISQPAAVALEQTIPDSRVNFGGQPFGALDLTYSECGSDLELDGFAAGVIGNTFVDRAVWPCLSAEGSESPAAWGHPGLGYQLWVGDPVQFPWSQWFPLARFQNSLGRTMRITLSGALSSGGGFLQVAMRNRATSATFGSFTTLATGAPGAACVNSAFGGTYNVVLPYADTTAMLVLSRPRQSINIGPPTALARQFVNVVSGVLI